MQEDGRQGHDGVDDVDAMAHAPIERLADNLRHDSLPSAAEDQLRAQEAFYRNIIEGAADVTTLVAPDGTILYASAAIAESTSLGYAPAEVIGRSSYDIVHPDDQLAVRQAIANDLAGSPTTVEARVLKRDRTWMWTEMRGKAILGLDGKTIVVAYSRDISARKRLEEQLKKSEEYFKSLLHGSSDLIGVIDLSGALRFTSDSVQRILGYRPDEVLGKQVFSFIHKDDVAVAAERLSRAAESSDLVTHLRVRRKDGTWSLCEGTAGAVTSPDGEPLLLINARDITERSRIDREHAMLAAIVESSDDAIVSNSLDQRITTWNKGAERMFGFSAEEAIGQPASLYMPPDLRAWGENFLNDLTTRLDRVQSFEVPCMRKDGSLVDVWTVCGAIRDHDGNLVGISAIHRDITERKRAEREQALLAALVRTTEDAIISYSTDFGITTWNRGAQRLLGYTPEEALGKKAYDLYVPSEARATDQARLIKDLEMIRKNPDAMRQLEMQVMRKDGVLLDAIIVGCGIHDSNGSLIGLSTIIHDVTARKLAVREQTQLATIVNASSDAIIGYSKELVITSWNPAAERTYGYSAEEAIGRGFDLFVSADQLPQALAADRRVLETGVSITFEQAFQRKDGSTFTSLVNIFPIRDREGNIVSGAGIGRDITERKRAERDLATLAAIVNASQDVIVNVSLEARITSWNPAAEKTYGYTPEEAIGKGIDLFVPPEELQETAARTLRVIETAEPVSWEQHPRRRDGTPLVFAVNIFPIRDTDGKVVSVAGIGRDITALKETERALVEAREAALTASQAKSEFLSSMSHEIRTPMTAILGMAELLAEGELNVEQRRYIEILCNNGHTLLDLINSILDLAKVESGRLVLERVAFDLCEVVGKSAQTLAIRAHSKGIELIVSVAPDVPAALLGDPLRLRQVLINLIGNAVKFTERGEVLVSVERDCSPTDKRRLKFSVRDTGIGIAKDKLPALFAAFSQADSSTARKYGGSGLGLAIVKRLVNLMQGEVTIQSEPGKGSTFTFTAPFELQPDPPAPEPWPDLVRVTILIVDPNRTARAVLRRSLSEHGANIVEAGSYAAGLAVIKQGVSAGRSPRIVLLDDRIAAQDAEELAQLIAAASDCGASIVAMLRCDNLAADISRLRSLKLETYLLKPTDTRELAKVLRGVIAAEAGATPREPRPIAKDPDQPPIIDRPLKILFADDSIDNRTLIRAFLRKTPYQLDEVENGRQAIDSFIAGHYDLVLMDIQMPEVDGYAATRAIRAWERDQGRTRTPIIALTASVFSDAVRLALAAGCDAHVGKPISKATLLRAIYDAIQGSAEIKPAP